MSYWPEIFIAYSAYVVATASPGPANLAIVATSVGAGRRAGIETALGVMGGSLVWGNLTAFGLAALLSQVAWLLVGLKITGGIFLLWLALRSFRSAIRGAPVSATKAVPAFGYVARGFAIHMTNPKAVFAWIAIITLGLREGAPFWVAGAILAGCAVLGVLIFGAYALAFSTDHMMRLYLAARRPVDVVVGFLFAGFGMKLLATRL